MFSNAVKLFDVLGFQIKVDPSWLLIAALIVWSLQTGYFPETVPGIGPVDSLMLSVVAMLGLFGGLILHELAHSLVARRFGLGVGGITLFLFGGVAELEQEPRDPTSEFWIALAGPAMSVVIAGIAAVATVALGSAGASPGIVALFEYLATINLVLAIFNMLPAFPLDGGRVLRAVLWRLRGDLLSATRAASAMGSLFAYLLILLGVVALFSEGSMLAGLWPILIGLFLLGAAKATYRQMLTKQALKGRTVGAIMTRAPRVTSPGHTVQELVEDEMLAHGLSFLPVVENGKLLGHIDVATVKGLERENWDAIRVGDVYVARSPTTAAHVDESLDSLFDRMMATGRRKFLVVNDGSLAGVITLTDLMSHLSVVQELGAETRRRPVPGKHPAHSV